MKRKPKLLPVVQETDVRLVPDADAIEFRTYLSPVITFLCTQYIPTLPEYKIKLLRKKAWNKFIDNLIKDLRNQKK